MENSQGSIVSVNVVNEMKGAYLDYAMSVIVGRALPDIRDGLKPVHRRVLYAMYDLSNWFDKPYKKSARIVGDVIGKYHPHGDSAVYDAIVRLAQDFSLRDPLVDGQGNFGSIDGDSAAAMRYTEIRLTKLAAELLGDLDKQTVDMQENYDGSLKEPTVLPARFPNLLVNGSTGIAVGMATNIPPHNLGEIVDCCLLLLANPDSALIDFKNHFKGPDFPTGGIIVNPSEIWNIYASGRGGVVLRGRAEVEISGTGRERIIITELPYQVLKSRLVEKIAELVKDKKLEGVSDLRDESNRDGMRVVVEVKKGDKADIVLNRLYDMTPLQDKVSVCLLAIKKGRPKIFNLLEMIKEFLIFRKEVLTRAIQYDLKKSEAKLHLLEGLKIALSSIDRVVQLIKSSSSPSQAMELLINEFKLTEVQSKEILDMRLQRLTAIEITKVESDIIDYQKEISRLLGILREPRLLDQLLKSDLEDVRQKFSTKRRTEVVLEDSFDIDVEDLIRDEPTVVILTGNQYVRRISYEHFRVQGRGGKGLKLAHISGEETLRTIRSCRTLDDLVFFTNMGRAYRLKAYKVPTGDRAGKGRSIHNLINLEQNENIVEILPIERAAWEQGDAYMCFATANGRVKKSHLSDFSAIRASGLYAVNLEPGDSLIGARLINENSQLVLLSSDGYSIRFDSSDIRPQGRRAFGVKGMKLSEGATVVAIDSTKNANSDGELLVVSKFGCGKRTALASYKSQGRAGRGIRAFGESQKTGPIFGALLLSSVSDEVVLVSKSGMSIRIGVSEISELGRSAGGVFLIDLDDGDEVIGIERLIT